MLKPFMDEAFRNKQKTKLSYDKLIIENKVYWYDDVNKCLQTDRPAIPSCLDYKDIWNVGQGLYSLISWNITGLNTKLNGTLFSRSDFLRFIKRSDIVCLTETWAGINDKYYIQGYSEYPVTRKKHVKAKKNSGGISIFVRTTLTKYITEIKSKSRNILWLHINFKKLHAKFNLLLGVIYVSPESSPIHAEENIFQILTEDFLRLKA